MDSFQKTSAKCREFIDFLSNHDISRDIELPQIAVMGDTSSGKSSLLSALSQIELPSSSELTTRCPTRLRMETNQVWRCQVHILWQNKNKKHVPIQVKNPEEITKTISEAQERILREEQESNKDRKVEVSKSVVEVMVYGPQYPDLTLIDLPGIVRTVGIGENESLVGDIRSLIDEYLNNERCLVLAVVPADVDFHNSSILADAKKVDPQTKRTLPVITKADRVDIGAEKPVINLLHGESTGNFELGFHAVKCRGQQDLKDNKSLCQSLLEEENFFAKKDPWSKIEDRSLLGVKQLKDKLSRVYMHMVQEKVPLILKEIEDMLSKVTRELGLMGEDLQSDYARRNMCRQLEKAMEDFKSMLTGSTNQRSMILPRDKQGFTHRARLERLKTRFAEDIHKTSIGGSSLVSKGDKVIVFDTGGIEVKGEVVDVRVDDEGKRSIYMKPDNIETDRIYRNPREEEKVKRQKHGNLMTIREKRSALMCPDDCRYKRGDLIEFADGMLGIFDKIEDKKMHFWDITIPYSDDEVWADQSIALLEKIKQNRGCNLQVFLDPDLFSSVVAQFVTKVWEPVALNFLGITHTIVKEFYLLGLKDVCHEKGLHESFDRFISFHQTRLEIELNKQLLITEKAVKDYISTELHPATLNHYLNENIQKCRQAKLKQRLKMMQDEQGNVSFTNIEMMLEANGRQSIDDYVVEEMRIILKAYAKVAEKRLIDTIPMIIESNLIKPIFTPSSNREDLFDASEQVLKMLAPSPQLVVKKEGLVRKKEGLTTAKVQAMNL
mmetsp:Transcript_21619/g.25574  ORF Transcript_21619/g.25574 Transcript_21619/m.25574 type:complete len:779 (+) Transcript_21619:38-2374(+)